MSTQEETIEALTRAILSEAREETEKIKAEAKNKADAIRKRAQEQAENEKKSILDRARQDAERLRSQSVASAQLKARSSQLEHREKILDKVFEGARQKLASVQNRSDFEKIAALLLREAITQMRVDSVEVHADTSTQKVLKVDAVSKETNAKITMGTPLKDGIGVVVEAGNGKLNYDNTLGTRLNRLKSALRASVHQVLMGEKL